MPNRRKDINTALKSNNPGFNRLLALVNDSNQSISDLERISHSVD